MLEISPFPQRIKNRKYQKISGRGKTQEKGVICLKLTIKAAERQL